MAPAVFCEKCTHLMLPALLAAALLICCLALPSEPVSRAISVHTPPLALVQAGALLSRRIEQASTKERESFVLAKGLKLAPWKPAQETELWRRLFARRDSGTDSCGVDWSAAVDMQFARWADVPRLSFEQLQQQYCHLSDALRVQVVGGEIRYATWRKVKIPYSSRMLSSLWLLQLAYDRAAAMHDPLPDIEFILSTNDCNYERASFTLPVLTSVQCHNYSGVSFPMTMHAQFGLSGALAGRMALSLYEQCHQQLQRLGGGPWARKLDSMFFSSGSDNAQVRAGDGTSCMHPFSCVTGTWVPGCAAGTARPARTDTDRQRAHQPLRPLPVPRVRTRSVAMAESWRPQPTRAGHCGWSRRLHELALMRAAVLMENSTCHEYLHYAFAPEHYVAVATDFHDVEPALNTLVGNHRAAADMADAWFDQGTRAVSLDCTLDYIASLARRYSAIQAEPPQQRDDWHLYTYETDWIDTEPREPGCKDGS